MCDACLSGDSSDQMANAQDVCRRYWSINLKEVRILGTSQGGEYLDGIRFTYEGGQIRSLLSLLNYFGKGEKRERSPRDQDSADQSQTGL